MTGNLCANCKWEVAAKYDDVDGIYRCSDCGSEIEGYEGGGGMTEFYEYAQNNSGGGFDVDDKLCHRVIIEATSAEQANEKAQELGIYFDGIDAGIDCDCCGDRWYSADRPAMSGKWSFDPPETTAEKFRSDIVMYAQYQADTWGWTTPDARIFYANGDVREIYKSRRKRND